MSLVESPSCTDLNVDFRRGPHARFWIARLGSVTDVTRARNGVATYHFMTRRSRAEKRNIAVQATSACSRCRPIPWIIQDCARTSKKPKNQTIYPEVIWKDLLYPEIRPSCQQQARLEQFDPTGHPGENRPVRAAWVAFRRGLNCSRKLRGCLTSLQWFREECTGGVSGNQKQSQSYWVDPYSPTKITENRVCPENWPYWAVFGSEFTTVDPDGILMQGQRLPTPNSPMKVMVVVVWRKGSRIDPICKKTAQTVRNFDPTGQSSYFFVLG
ncbi:hypothetical protein CRG98_009572 [Punica granatum]|uniref:Uncharacterized protein n=1 Tax=Punica granatum TaxID=22663 RepID=A0A2I0KNU3_PUNGR|nr:hypothetical protein CRG98_009572 [Punica granatum]